MKTIFQEDHPAPPTTRYQQHPHTTTKTNDARQAHSPHSNPTAGSSQQHYHRHHHHHHHHARHHHTHNHPVAGYSIIPQDTFLCIFYTRDEKVLRALMRNHISAIALTHKCPELCLLNEKLPIVGVRALFLLAINADQKLRHYIMENEAMGVHKPKPAKVCRFLRSLRDDIIPRWMSNEKFAAQDLVRTALENYIRS